MPSDFYTQLLQFLVSYVSISFPHKLLQPTLHPPHPLFITSQQHTAAAAAAFKFSRSGIVEYNSIDLNCDCA